MSFRNCSAKGGEGRDNCKKHESGNVRIDKILQ